LAVFLIGSNGLFISQNSSLRKENQDLNSQINKLRESTSGSQSESKTTIERVIRQKRRMQQALVAAKKEAEVLKEDLEKARHELETAFEEKTYLEDILIHKTREMELLKKGPTIAPATTSAPISTQGPLAQKLKEKEAEVKRLSEQNKALSHKLEQIYKTTNDKISEINVAKITLDETISKARQSIEKEWDTIDLGSISVEQPGSLKITKPETRKAPKREGHVLAVNENHGFVVVDIGKIDGIQNNSKLSLKKNGQTVGLLSVLEIRDVMTACNIHQLAQGQKVEINDLVAIQK
jgi:DNA repair exonuclease SbcCD ATPase subunit